MEVGLSKTLNPLFKKFCSKSDGTSHISHLLDAKFLHLQASSVLQTEYASKSYETKRDTHYKNKF